ADSVVLETYTDGSGRCGIGFKIQLDSGAVYVYCHLSYLEPSVVVGAALAAGAPVGLVGSTGDATGPHLHLQLTPPVASPQAEGGVKGYAAITVTVQNPAPGTRVVDNGAPVVVLGLARNSAYGESGQPENDAPFNGTRVVLVSEWAPTTSTGTTSVTTTETTP